MYLCFVLFLVCLYICICECLLQNNMRIYTSNQHSQVWGPLQECLRFCQALLGYLITAHHLYASLMELSCYLCGGITNQKPKKNVWVYVCVCKCLIQNNMQMYTSMNIHRSGGPKFWTQRRHGDAKVEGKGTVTRWGCRIKQNWL